MRKIFLTCSLLFILSACSSQPKIGKKLNPSMNDFEDLTSQYNGAILKTSLGDIKFEFYNQASPQTVNNFLNLAAMDYYDNTKFHSVVRSFAIKGGDPNTRGSDRETYGAGGPNYSFADEINDHKLKRGSIAMYNVSPDSNSSQFMIILHENPDWLNGRNTNFGQAVDGFDVLSQIEKQKTDVRNCPVEDIILQDVKLIKKSDSGGLFSKLFKR